MKLSEIITRVQRQFGDDIQAQITKEDIVRWVNDACLEIAMTNRTNEGTFKGVTPVTAGQSEYSLPSDLLALRAVRVNGRALDGTTYDQLTKTGLLDSTIEVTGEPQFYWVHGGNLSITPTPVDSLGTVDIMYVKTPDIMTVDMLDKQIDVPKQYHLRVVEYCIAQAAELDDNLGQYQMKMNQFEKNLQSLRQNGTQPDGDDYYPYITYTSEVF